MGRGKETNFLPTSQLPDIGELHRRTHIAAQEEGKKLDVRVPLLLRAAMNLAVAEKLKALPQRQVPECWCETMYRTNKFDVTFVRNGFFMEHWKNCRKRNTVTLDEVIATSGF